MRKPIAIILGAAGLQACTVGPEYEPPAMAVPAEFRFSIDGAIDAADTEWWRGFEDPVLDALIDESLANNNDIRTATANVEQFAAVIGLTRSQAFPQVDYDAGLGRTQNSRETGAAASGRVSDFFEANLNVGWEVDIFGRIRRATDAAVADTLAAEEVRRGVILSLVTNVASTYIALLSLDEQLVIAERKLDTRRDTVDLFQLRLDRGIASALELEQVKSELERTAATIPSLRRDIAILENALSVLLGRPPGEIARGKTIETVGVPPIPAGLPSELLLRRPDLREAEQNLIAANERIGEAIAEFYPSFNLTAAFGFASDELQTLFQSSASQYTLGASMLGPIFTAGFLENQLESAEASERAAVSEYREALLTALRESEDALVTRSTTLEESAAQSRQTDALSRYADLAQKRYDNGYVDYLEVLDAERDLFDAQLEKVQLRADALTSVIEIYKAFGGGWVDLADSQTGPRATVQGL